MSPQLSGSCGTLTSPRVRQVLDRLYDDTLNTDPVLRRAAAPRGITHEGQAGFYEAISAAYMPVTPEFGKLLYGLVRATRARMVVEYGTSFGISTLFLAAALRDNGGGHLITGELQPFKAERAREHFAAAGLADLIELRVGDARETLACDLPRQVDLVLLDGLKSSCLAVL